VRKEREKNEEMLVILVEQMVEKMKKEIIELDMWTIIIILTYKC